jgi:hypothetical protein
VNRRAIFCLTDHSIAGYASAARRNIAVQSPASEPVARIHSKRETSQISLPIAHRPRPSKQPATPEIFRLGLGYPLFKAYKADWKIGALGQWLAT